MGLFNRKKNKEQVNEYDRQLDAYKDSLWSAKSAIEKTVKKIQTCAATLEVLPTQSYYYRMSREESDKEKANLTAYMDKYTDIRKEFLNYRTINKDNFSCPVSKIVPFTAYEIVKYAVERA